MDGDGGFENMKIYIAHNFKAREYLPKFIIPAIIAQGHEVTSTWITDASHISSYNKRQSAEIDLADIDRADAILLFVDQYGERHGKGKFLELGYAYAKGKRCFLYGPDDSCIFYSLIGMERVTTDDQLFKLINKH